MKWFINILAILVLIVWGTLLYLVTSHPETITITTYTPHLPNITEIIAEHGRE